METGSLGTKDIWAIEPGLEGEDMICKKVFVNSLVMEHHLRGNEGKDDERSPKQEIVSLFFRFLN
jgi:hypothetical protein